MSGRRRWPLFRPSATPRSRRSWSRRSAASTAPGRSAEPVLPTGPARSPGPLTPVVVRRRAPASATRRRSRPRKTASAIPSSGVGSRFTMMRRAPACRATRGMEAAGSTTSEEPATSIRSHASAATTACVTTSCGIVCPNEIVAGFRNPSHRRQRGARSPAATRRQASSIEMRSSQSRQYASVVVPCSSNTASAGSPAR